MQRVSDKNCKCKNLLMKAIHLAAIREAEEESGLITKIKRLIDLRLFQLLKNTGYT